MTVMLKMSFVPVKPKGFQNKQFIKLPKVEGDFVSLDWS